MIYKFQAGFSSSLYRLFLASALFTCCSPVIAESTQETAAEAAWAKNFASGRSHYRDKHLPAAEKYLKLALADAEALPESSNKSHLFDETLHALSEVYDAQNAFAKADIARTRSRYYAELSFGPVHPFLSRYFYDDGLRALDHGKPHEAEILFRRAVEIREKLKDKRSSEYFRFLAGLAKSLMQQHKYTEAEQIYVLCLKNYYPALESLDIRLKDLADCYAAQGRSNEAKRFYQRSKEVSLQFQDMRRAVDLSTKANRLFASGMLQQAEKLHLSAVDIISRYSAPALQKVEVLNGYSRFLYKVNRASEAAKIEIQAKKAMMDYDKIDQLPTGLIFQ
ncbi:MAG TPA: hypothetical protein PKH78_01185 [Candidatus Obscuribacter sp.]|nr:hypothetical protein [Candidatus Obscuribacter sp.]HNN61618.1 hypothetical protein [Candidatus Obscuribacter sp.]